MDVVTLGQARAQGDKRYARVPAGVSFADSTGARKSTLCLTNPNIATGAAVRDVCQRLLLRNPTTSTKWRLRIANRQHQSDTVFRTTPTSLTGLWVGAPAYETASPYRWSGNFAAVPTKVWGGGVVPVDGTELVSPWITSANFQASVEMLLSMGLTTANSGTGIVTDQSIQTWMVSAGGSAVAGDQNLTGAAFSNAPFLDIRVEFYTNDLAPIGLFLGDSITKGFGDGDANATRIGVNPHEAWPGIAGLRARFNYINLGAEGTKASDIAALTGWFWNRIDLATTIPDFAVIAFGANDSSAGQSSTAILLSIFTLMDKLTALGIKRIYLATITPRTFGGGGTITAATNVGDTSVTSTVTVGVGAGVVLDVGRSGEFKTVTAVTGTGPYTFTVSALTKAHAAGAQVITGKEINRTGANELIRSLPHGAAGVLDFDALMAISSGSGNFDPRLVSADLLHPLRAGYARMGTEAASFRL